MPLNIKGHESDIAVTNRWALKIENDVDGLKKASHQVPNVAGKVATAVSQTTSAPITLNVPGSIFTPETQTTKTSPPTLGFSLLPEPTNTVFAGPVNGNGFLDSSTGAGGSSSTPVNISLNATAANELAFFFVATQGAGPGTPNPGTGWTLIPSLGTFTTIYYQFFPPIGSASIIAPAFGQPWGAVLAFFGTNGNAPVLAQAAVQGFSISSPTTASAFASNNTAGNTIVVAVSVENVSSSVNGVLSDTLGNTYTFLGQAQDPSVNNQAFLYGATNISAGANTVKFTWTGSGGVTITAIEFKNLAPVAGFPTFRKLASQDLPAIAFSDIASGTSTTAAMVVGSGASLNPGGTGIINATEIDGITVTGTPSVGQVLTATSSTAADWATPSAGGSPGGSNGDVQFKQGTNFVHIDSFFGNGSVFNATGSGPSATLNLAPAQNLQLNPFRLGVFGATPISQPTVTGSRGGNVALASLLTALATLGIVIDSSTP